MNVMTQKSFEIAVNGFWTGFASVLRAERELARLNLTMKDTVISGIESLKDSFVENVMELMDIEESRKDVVRQELKNFIRNAVRKCGIRDKFMDYPHAMYTLFHCADGKLPFYNDNPKRDWNDQVIKHRGLSMKNLKPVTGYALAFHDRVFIVRAKTHVTYDPMACIIIADKAVEVCKETVVPDFGISDDLGNRLFENDVVESGSERFVLRPNNRYVLQLLENRHVNGLRRVKMNYDDFRAKQMENGSVDADIAVEIVDADSEVDSNTSVRMELEEAGMEDRLYDITVRHPEPEKKE